MPTRRRRRHATQAARLASILPCLILMGCIRLVGAGAGSTVSASPEYGSGSGWMVSIAGARFHKTNNDKDPMMKLSWGGTLVGKGGVRPKPDSDRVAMSPDLGGLPDQYRPSQFRRGARLVAEIGLGGHWTESGAWGFGPNIGIGIGIPLIRDYYSVKCVPILNLVANAYLGLGSDGEDFDVTLEGNVTLGVFAAF